MELGRLDPLPEPEPLQPGETISNILSYNGEYVTRFAKRPNPECEGATILRFIGIFPVEESSSD